MIDADKLKPCPFCGSDAKLVENYQGQVKIKCTNLVCGVSPGGWFDDPYGDARYAVYAWNKRCREDGE